MTGPYPPHHGMGPGTGPRRPPPPSPQRRPPPPGPQPDPYPLPPPGAYPGLLPPPVPYPRKSRKRAVGLVLVFAVVAALAGLIGYTLRGMESGSARGAGPLIEADAKTAIQGYLNALADRDIEAIARNTLCGIYDEVTDRRPDDAVAKMSSDAFRRQFSRAELTSIDKIVYLSDLQAQALFTMKVTRASNQRRDDTQGVAQLLAVDGHILVCSYVLRSAGTN